MLDRLLRWIRDRWGWDRVPPWERALNRGLDNVWRRGDTVDAIHVSLDILKSMFRAEHYWDAETNRSRQLYRTINIYDSSGGPIIVALEQGVRPNEIRLLVRQLECPC